MKSVVLLLPLILSSCSGAPPRHDSFPSVICEQLIGRGWTPLAAPPENSGQLQGLLRRPGLSNWSALWFLGQDDSVAVCYYASDVCGSEAHVFRRSGAQWIIDDSGVADWICVA